MAGRKPFTAAVTAAILAVLTITEPATAAAVSIQESASEVLEQELAVSSNSENAVWKETEDLPEAEIMEDSELEPQAEIFAREQVFTSSAEKDFSEENSDAVILQDDKTTEEIDLLDQETLDRALAEGLVEFQPSKEYMEEDYQRAGAASGDIVDIASREVGVSGRPNKYTYWLGTIAGTYSYAWCHAFVSWCGAQAGASQVPRTASCFYGAQEFRAQGRWQNRISGYVPKSGDIIYFDWDANGGYDHVGIVNYVSAGRVHTIEGNAGNAVKYDGGRTGGYALTDSQIIGYGTPDYAPAPKTQGCLDSVTGGACSVKVKGWAFDRKVPEQALSVHVYVGGVAGSGAPGYAIEADQERTDVEAAYPGVGNYHGFDASILVSKTGTQPVYVYAISAAEEDPNPMIGSGTVTIKADTKAPAIKNVKVEDISAEGYTVTCKVTDNVGVQKVEFLAWHDSKSREEAIRFEGTIEDGMAKCFIPIEALGNQSGNYVTYICAYDLAGNAAEAAADMVAINLTSLKQYKMSNLSSSFLASIETEDGTAVLTGQEDIASVCFQSNAKNANQIWEFQRAEDGSYAIRMTSNGAYLAAADAIHLTDSDQEGNHFWQIYQAKEDRYYLNPQSIEERVLGISPGNESQEQKAILDTFQAVDEQRFYIRKLSTNVESLRLNKSSLSLTKAGQTKSLTAAIKPVSAADEKICWTTSNAQVAMVDKNGLVTAVGNGTADIAASTEDGSITAVCKVTVAIKVTGVELNKHQIILESKGEKLKLAAAVLPGNAENQEIVWSSSNAKVAAVDQSGTVTAASNGTAVITVQTAEGNKAATCTASVQIPKVGAGGKVKSGSYTYSADFIQDASGTRTVIYRQKKGGAKKELAQVQAKAYLKLVRGKKLYYEEAEGSGKRNLCAMDTKTFQTKTVRLNASIIDSYGGRFLIKPYSAKTKPQTCYLFYAASGREKRISTRCLAARITKSKIYYVKAVSGNTGKGWQARVHSCSLTGGRDKYLTGKIKVADCKKLTGKSIIYQSGKSWYEYIYTSKKKNKVNA